MNKIIQGDSLILLAKATPNSIDAIVTDPPYGLSFMGKKWDYDVPSVDIWKECYRVLKPGGYLLSFAGTRTQHRMAVNIEDAGFEIRDMIAWVYGSGFPKSLNIGKAVDKLQGNEREMVGTQMLGGNAAQSIKEKGGTYASNTNAVGVKPIEVTLTKGTSEWEGWGTALKPALEPITVARKPLGEKTVAENVLKWGTGGINIDGSRVATDDNPKGSGNRVDQQIYQPGWKGNGGNTTPEQGRFPANLIHDGSDEVTDLLNDSARFFYCAKASKADRDEGLDSFEENRHSPMGYERGLGDLGEGMFKDRNTQKRNSHPTVKPTKLMQYLVKLVTPKGGVVLDPFMGSGSTGKACKLEGFDFIGIELDPEYCKIAETRINAVVQPIL